MGSHQTLKVCHVISGDLWAGPEVQVNALLRELRADPALQLSAIVLNPGRLADSLAEAGIAVTVINERRHTFMQIMSTALDVVRSHKPNILHSHRYKENILAAILQWRTLPDARLVQTVHGIQERFTGYQSLKIRLYQGLNEYVTSRYFSRVLPVSHEIAGHLEKRFGRERLTVVHNAVNVDAIKPQRCRAQLLAELGFAEPVKLVGTVGRMVPIKGFEQFLEMARQVSDRLPETRFLLTGEGPLLETLRAQARSIGLEERVFFLGFRSDVWDILNALDLFVMSSHHEGIPVVLLEAMALRRATVATAVGGVPEVIQEGISGRLVKPGDVPGLTAAALELLQDPPAGEKLGQAARERIIAEFSVAGQARQMRQIYEKVIARV